MAPRSGEIYGALYSVALATAARRAFPGGYTSDTRADVIRFVARLRGAVAGTDDDFKPRVAGHVLISMLGGPEDIETLDKRDLAVVIMLIGGLLAYLGIEEGGIDDFLSERAFDPVFSSRKKRTNRYISAQVFHPEVTSRLAAPWLKATGGGFSPMSRPNGILEP